MVALTGAGAYAAIQAQADKALGAGHKSGSRRNGPTGGLSWSMF